MQEKRIHDIFVASVLFKGIHAAIEIIGGAALYLVSTETIVNTINRWSYDELVDDKDDWIANPFAPFRADLFGRRAQIFYAFYLLSHGIIKSILVISGLLLREIVGLPGELRSVRRCSSATSSTATASPMISG